MVFQNQILAGSSGSEPLEDEPESEGNPASGFTARYKAVPDNVTESSGAVSQWDNIGSASDWDVTQSDASKKPTFTQFSSNMNDRGSISFDGSNDFLDTNETNGAEIITTTAFTIYIALFQEDDSGNTGHNTGTYWAAPGQYWGMHAGVTNQMYGSGYEHVSVTVNDDTLCCIEWRYDGSTQTFTVALAGGATVVTDSASSIGSLTYSSNGYTMGGGGVGTNSGSGSSGMFEGEIGEMIFYNSHLSSGNRSTCQTYFANRYGVSWS